MNAERLAEIKAWLERIDPAYKNHDVVVDSRDLITALEAAQERIAELEAEVDEYGDLSEENLHLAGINIGADREILRLETALLSMQQAWQGIK